jgi:hypothetical protein
MGILGVTPDTFFDMSPKEVHFAVQSTGELRRAQAEHDYEVARYTAVGVINLTSTILKERITDPQAVFPLPWDKKKSKEQSVEEMKKSAMALVAAFGGVIANKGPDDPPRVLAKTHRK